MTARPGRPPDGSAYLRRAARAGRDLAHRDTKPENTPQTWEEREPEIHARAAALILALAPWEPDWIRALRPAPRPLPTGPAHRLA